MPDFRLVVLVLPALIGSFAVGILMIFGARKMMRLESYRWAMAASILALLPCSPVGLLGLVMGIWSLVVLNRGNVIAAFDAQTTARNGPRPAGPTSARRRSNALTLVVLVAVVLVGIPLGLVVIALGVSSWFAYQAHEASQQQSRLTPESRWADRLSDIPVETVWERDWDRLSVTHELGQSLQLCGQQIEAIDKSLQAFYRDYRALEQQNLQQSTDAEGHQVTKIAAISEPVSKLEERFWADVESGLNDGRSQTYIGRQRRSARDFFGELRYEMFRASYAGFQSKPAPAIRDLPADHRRFPDADFRIEIWQAADQFHWRATQPASPQLSQDQPASAGADDFETVHSAAALPPEFRRFWRDPTDAAPLAEKLAAPVKVNMTNAVIARIEAGTDTKTLVVSPDNQRVAYVGRRRHKHVAVIDGQPGEEYIDIKSIVFSPDSKRVAYIAGLGDRRRVVLNGERGKEYVSVDWGLVFSPVSQTLAYLATNEPVENRKWFLVVDGIEMTRYRAAGGHLVISPDSQRLAYVAEQDRARFVIIDGKPEPGAQAYEFVPYLVFSPDSARLAYVGRRDADNRYVVVADGAEGKWYNETSVPVFSPDSRRWAYVARREYQDQYVVVMDGKEAAQHAKISFASVRFSPDSRHLAYVAQTGGKWRVILDGTEGPSHDRIGTSEWWDGGLQFSPDSNRLAYVAKRGYEPFSEFVVLDYMFDKSYEGIIPGSLAFNPDGRHVAYGARRDAKTLVVVDGIECFESDGFLEGTQFIFDRPDSFHALVLRGDEVVRVDVEITEPDSLGSCQ